MLENKTKEELEQLLKIAIKARSELTDWINFINYEIGIREVEYENN